MLSSDVERGMREGRADAVAGDAELSNVAVVVVGAVLPGTYTAADAWPPTVGRLFPGGRGGPERKRRTYSASDVVVDDGMPRAGG